MVVSIISATHRHSISIEWYAILTGALTRICILYFCIDWFSKTSLWSSYFENSNNTNNNGTHTQIQYRNGNASFFVTHATDAAENSRFQTKDNICCNTYLALVHACVLVIHSTCTIGRFKPNFWQSWRWKREREKGIWKKENPFLHLSITKKFHISLSIYSYKGKHMREMKKKENIVILFTEICKNKHGLRSKRRVLSDDFFCCSRWQKSNILFVSQHLFIYQIMRCLAGLAWLKALQLEQFWTLAIH